jgi:hypothetical protein
MAKPTKADKAKREQLEDEVKIQEQNPRDGDFHRLDRGGAK